MLINYKGTYNMNIDNNQILEQINQFNTQYKDFKDYILKCFDWYKQLDNQSWRDEFEDVHSIEFFANGFINIRCGLQFDAGYNDQSNSRINLPDQVKEQITDYYFLMVKYLLQSKNLDNIYLIKRILWNGLPGFYSDSIVRDKNNDLLEQIYQQVCEDPQLQQESKSYKVTNRI